MVFPFALPDPWPSSKTLLPLMDWEKQAMDILDLHKDQLRFTVALVASVFVGMGLQALRDPTGVESDWGTSVSHSSVSMHGLHAACCTLQALKWHCMHPP